MNPRRFKVLYDAASNAVKRAIKSNIDDAISKGKFSSNFRNSDEVLNALGRGALNPSELGVVTKALINNGDTAIRSQIADALTNNSSFTTKYLDNLTEKEVRAELSRVGFENDAIEEVIKNWKSKGNSFRTIYSEGVKNLFKDFLSRSNNVQRIKALTFKLTGVDRNIDKTIQRMAAKVKTQARPNLTQEISDLTALATAAKRSDQKYIKTILEDFITNANIPNEQKRQIRLNLQNNTYYNDWLELVKGLDNVHVLDYTKSYKKLWPKTYVNGKWVWNSEFFNRWGNFIAYANPMTRTEMLQQMMKYGVPKATASMIVTKYIRTLIIAPLAVSTYKMVEGLIKGDDVSWKDDFVDAAWENFSIIGLDKYTNIDDFYYVFNTPRSEILDEFYGTDEYSEEDIFRMLDGTYVESEGEETSNVTKSRAVRNYLNGLYRNDSSAEEYISRVSVVSGNKVVYKQKTNVGLPKNIPMTIYNGKIYLVNKEIGKMIEFSNLWN